MSGKLGFGTIFSITVDSTLTAVADLTSISGPEISVDEVDVSSHDSPDMYREFIPGLKDGGSVSIEGNFTNAASQGNIQGLIDGDAKSAMTIDLPESLASWAFDGFITSFSTDTPYDDKITFSATIKVTGQPVLT